LYADARTCKQARVRCVQAGRGRARVMRALCTLREYRYLGACWRSWVRACVCECACAGMFSKRPYTRLIPFAYTHTCMHTYACTHTACMHRSDGPNVCGTHAIALRTPSKHTFFPLRTRSLTRRHHVEVDRGGNCTLVILKPWHMRYQRMPSCTRTHVVFRVHACAHALQAKHIDKDSKRSARTIG